MTEECCDLLTKVAYQVKRLQSFARSVLRFIKKAGIVLLWRLLPIEILAIGLASAYFA